MELEEFMNKYSNFNQDDLKNLNEEQLKLIAGGINNSKSKAMSSALASILSVLTLAPMGVSAAETHAQAEPQSIGASAKSSSQLNKFKDWASKNSKYIIGGGIGTAGAALIVGALAYAFRQKDITKMSDEEINKLSKEQALNLLPGTLEKFLMTAKATRKTAMGTAWKDAGEAAKATRGTAREAAWETTWKDAWGAVRKAVGGSAGEATEEAGNKAFANSWRKGGEAYKKFTSIRDTGTANNGPYIIVDDTRNRAIDLLKVLKAQIKTLENAIKQANNKDRNRMLDSATNISDASKKYHAYNVADTTR